LKGLPGVNTLAYLDYLHVLKGKKSFVDFASVDVVFTDNLKKLALTQTRKDTSLVSG
jgi:hypothetical protein